MPPSMTAHSISIVPIHIQASRMMEPRVASPKSARLTRTYSLTKNFCALAKRTPEVSTGGLRCQLTLMNPNVALAKPASMREMMGESVGEQRFRTLVLGSFAGFALLLACFGIYAVMSYSVGQRTRELGIRIALGAKRGELLGLVLRE